MSLYSLDNKIIKTETFSHKSSNKHRCCVHIQCSIFEYCFFFLYEIHALGFNHLHFIIKIRKGKQNQQIFIEQNLKQTKRVFFYLFFPPDLILSISFETRSELQNLGFVLLNFVNMLRLMFKVMFVCTCFENEFFFLSFSFSF